MTITILDFVVISSSALGYFISINLLTSHLYRNKANKYLSTSLFLINSIMLLGRYDPNGGILEFLKDLMWEFLFPVTLFIYFLIQLNHSYLKKKWRNWLYLPFFATSIIDIFFDLDFVFKMYSLPFSENNSTIQFFYITEEISSFFYSIILIIWSRNLIENSSSISKEKKKWLLRFNLFLIFAHVIWFMQVLEDIYLDSEYSLNLLWFLISILSWWILYYGIFKLQIVIQRDEIHEHLKLNNLKKTELKEKKTITSTSTKVMNQFYSLMEDEELYKNPLLSRLDLANQLGISESYLSQIINQETKKSIIQLVNEYRIESAKNQLREPALYKYSVEAIGIESGFKSKSAFYNVFKTLVGTSPGEYRKQ
ncbi:AraC-like DNA-binding protein [Aquimarina sp. MAR_2010_214]|uniref:helix-turn-helix domain-containing protein n=1 Tax=Aquimarina sp. MAR_2010_214 TaxID=1250026 RepID=UPI000C70FE3A|nr:helix-turn-helix domain-containing protein [Aquimarina sp. MAR_2010_214]PKV50394.1 AraC-like DNA-binding protein [Aquimarina sp. MAR_2010_214]